MASRIRKYVPQRHTFPVIAWSMSASVGFGLLANNDAADMSCPAWQYPHCGTSSSSHAFCNGCDPSTDNPSIVVTGAFTAEIWVWQALRACPPIWTVQAPHCPIPHPNFVPFMLTTSLSTQRRGMSGGTSTVFDCPFTVNL